GCVFEDVKFTDVVGQGKIRLDLEEIIQNTTSCKFCFELPVFKKQLNEKWDRHPSMKQVQDLITFSDCSALAFIGKDKSTKLTTSVVLPHMGLVLKIKAVSYDVCGSIPTIDLYKAKLTHGSDNIKPHMKHADENGCYCFEDSYLFTIQPDATPDLLFSPPHINDNGPLMSSKFYQIKVKRILAEINEQMLTIVKGAEFDAEVAEIWASIVNKANEQGETGLFKHAEKGYIEVNCCRILLKEYVHVK
ncbi:hypothetical protein Tco_1273471, partial [Tanacetum coccineum]